jgi:hypothetical protein
MDIVINLSFSARAGHGPGSRSEWTSWLKVYTTGVAMLFAVIDPRMTPQEHYGHRLYSKLSAAKSLGLHDRRFGAPLPLFKRLAGRSIPKIAAVLPRFEKVALSNFPHAAER